MAGGQSGQNIAAGAFGVIALFAFIVGFIFYAAWGLLPHLAKPTGGTIIVSNSCVTPLLPTIVNDQKFSAAIDQYITKYASGSPFRGMGADFVAAGKAHGINPAWEVNIARKESVFGTMGWAVQHANNAFGRTAGDGQPSITSPTGKKWYKYDSFKDSISNQAEYLKRRFVDKGLTTFDSITPVYCPPSECDTPAYIKQMEQWVGEVVGLAGDSLQCQDTGAGNAPPKTTP